ncbi:MAG: 3'-5' exonuclease [Clostridiales bacterium]|nr:3'-5' exonuclease [Clostridiales bacterium]MCD8133359.1 3'-5' exonuclease [Clostridiales bacterium]
MDSFVAVDLEMTGLKVKSDRILEIGAVKAENGRMEETFQIFVNPHRSLDETIIRLTGITDEMVSSAPDPEEAIGTFLSFAGDLPLLGHNLMFDYSFLKQAAVNCGYLFERKGVDTLKIARKVLEEPESKSLDSLCAFFHIQRDRCHRAFDDAEAACRLFFLLKERYGQTEPELFVPQPLMFRVKKQGKITPAQKRDLNHLFIYHRIENHVDVENMTRSEASRMINEIYVKYGRVPEQEERLHV